MIWRNRRCLEPKWMLNLSKEFQQFVPQSKNTNIFQTNDTLDWLEYPIHLRSTYVTAAINSYYKSRHRTHFNYSDIDLTQHTSRSLKDMFFKCNLDFGLHINVDGPPFLRNNKITYTLRNIITNRSHRLTSLGRKGKG